MGRDQRRSKLKLIPVLKATLKKSPFQLESSFKPQGDQPQAIRALLRGLREGKKRQALLGVTGSGKTFSMAHVIQKWGKKTLVLAPNKTLAAQLYGEFKELFPQNAVEYFVSYYDFYRPEAYVAQSDTYIEKDASINDEIDKLRHSTTHSLSEREDAIVVASVSCIYGIGSPDEYARQKVILFEGEEVGRDDFLTSLVGIHYERNDIDFSRGCFRVRGDTVDVFPSYEDSHVVRIEFFGDEVEKISVIDPLRGQVLKTLKKVIIYPKSHYALSRTRLKMAVQGIKEELRECLKKLQKENKLLERQRLEQRTLLDLEMLEEMGVCPGIENYSRHLIGGRPGEPPPTLLDYFFKDFLMIIDESHVACPQIAAMYKGDRSRKMSLVEHGFRLPSALDNRPLRFEEFEQKVDDVVFVSATLGDYELRQTKGEYIEQIIRPTGLLDPLVKVHKASRQVDDILLEARKAAKEGFRTLITTLTKKLAEDLTTYFRSQGEKIRYLHSDIDTLERMEILQDLREGKFDILVGINLLREGLDLPEVALVGILDADKEGFLRSERSLIQTIGRAARNSKGRVILYASKETLSIQRALRETERRRERQEAYNKKHGINPQTVVKKISGGVIETLRGVKVKQKSKRREREPLTEVAIEKKVGELKVKMKSLARRLKFEEAAEMREEIKSLLEARMFL